ncbi:hypothetical protein HJC23_013501 [Cyclotella cryptica]|uniref:Uncharacterized protein n=1 Tax=Cyclotella cryptica TaxID=29204 RepID=A0ABD3Q2A1_9STRA
MMTGDESDNSNSAAEWQQPITTSAAADVGTDRSIGENMTNNDTNQQDEALRRLETELNVALESLEAMRRANLEVEFSASCKAAKVDHERCTFCQRDQVRQAASNAAVAAVPQDVREAAEAGLGGRLRDVKLDGRRIRSFRQRFMSKSATSFEADSSHDPHVDNSDAYQVDKQTSHIVNVQHELHSTESCPDRLENDQPQTNAQSTATATATTIESSNNGTLETKSRKITLRRMPRACLTCGHPTCSKHISNAFSTHHIHICQNCAFLFELDFLVDVIAQASQQQNQHDNDDNNYNNNNMQQCQERVNEIIDCYDRAKLLLIYTSQYADDISTGLQSRTEKSNKIGVGANASGIVSGITGIVGAGALLFPPVAAAGVPILIASLVFGGGATAAHTGDYAAVKYWSEPNMLADKMVLLHGMCLSLLRIVEVLNFELSKRLGYDESNSTKQENNAERVDGDQNGSSNSGEEQTNGERQMLARDIRTLLEKHGVNTKLGKQAITAGTNITGSNVACRHSRFLGRVGATAANSFRFVPLAGGMLSAASLVVEANEIKKTLARMNEGNPCEKSIQISEIKDEVGKLPDASLIAGECKRVFEEAKREPKWQEAGGAKTGTISTTLTSLDNVEFERVVAKEMAAAKIGMDTIGSAPVGNIILNHQ